MKKLLSLVLVAILSLTLVSVALAAIYGLGMVTSIGSVAEATADKPALLG